MKKLTLNQINLEVTEFSWCDFCGTTEQIEKVKASVIHKLDTLVGHGKNKEVRAQEFQANICFDCVKQLAKLTNEKND